MEQKNLESTEQTPSANELKEWNAMIDSGPVGIIIVLLIIYSRVNAVSRKESKSIESKLDEIINLLKNKDTKN